MEEENKKKYQKQEIKNKKIQENILQDPLLKDVCRNFMNSKCERDNCRFIHDKNLCNYFWKNGSCKYKDGCRKKHYVTVKESDLENKQQKKEFRKKPKNTECFEPMKKPVDLRVVMDLGTRFMSTPLTSRDVLLVPNLFEGYKKGDIYSKLVKEIEESKVPNDQLLKMWHGNEKIEGTHLICNDRTPWKRDCPTFNMVIERLTDFFKMDVKATRLNWYTSTEQWKPFHHDSAAVNPEKAATQNFTVAISFGATRDCAFEHAKTKSVVSFPIGDGEIYCFLNDTNLIWRHGVLQEFPFRQEGRISIICWGWVDGVMDIN